MAELNTIQTSEYKAIFRLGDKTYRRQIPVDGWDIINLDNNPEKLGAEKAKQVTDIMSNYSVAEPIHISQQYLVFNETIPENSKTSKPLKLSFYVSNAALGRKTTVTMIIPEIDYSKFTGGFDKVALGNEIKPFVKVFNDDDVVYLVG